MPDLPTEPMLDGVPFSPDQCFPISVKGVIFRGDAVCLLKNDRGEWELPGGRLEIDETPPACVAREILEETGLRVKVVPAPVHAWLYEPVADRYVFVVAYLCEDIADDASLALSAEHSDGRWVQLELEAVIDLPSGYRDAIKGLRITT